MKDYELLQKMAQRITQLEAEKTQLREALNESNKTIAKLTARLDILDQRAAARARRQFSSGSERSSALKSESEQPIPEDAQFDEAEASAEDAAPEGTGDAAPKAAEDAAGKPPKRKRKKSIGRMKFPDELPREDILVNPQEFANLSETHRASLNRIGEDVVEVLDYQPGVLKVKRYILAKYADPKHPSHGVLQASRPADRIIRGGMVSNGLLAASFSDKFIYHLPYARQSIRFENIGCPISRQNLSRWQIQVTDLVLPLTSLVENHILSQSIVHMDETTLQVMEEKDRENTQKSYIWLRVYDKAEAPAVSYRYYATRAKTAAEELTVGFEGIVQSDGYAAYRSIVKQSDGRLRSAFCLTHVRRKFYDIVIGTDRKKNKSKQPPAAKGIRKTAQQMVKDIGEIFALESRLREQLKRKQLSEEEFLQKRKAQAEELFATFKKHLDEQKEKVIPQTPLAGAINYALNLFDGLQTYLGSLDLGPDNSAAERAVRAVALGRSNWNFSGSPAGAHSSCAMYTLLQTARLNHLDPGAYMKHVLDKASVLVDKPYDESAWKALLPWNLKPEDLEWQDRSDFFTSN